MRLKTSDITIEALQPEHASSGFGIGCSRPRLSWRYGSTTVQDWVQKRYELVIQINQGPRHSYELESESNTYLSWPADTLVSRDRCQVSVRASGSDGLWTRTCEVSIEVGLLERSNWEGQVISCPPQPADQPKDVFGLVQSFEVAKAFKNARVYITALGLYELYLNVSVSAVTFCHPVGRRIQRDSVARSTMSLGWSGSVRTPSGRRSPKGGSLGDWAEQTALETFGVIDLVYSLKSKWMIKSSSRRTRHGTGLQHQPRSLRYMMARYSTRDPLETDGSRRRRGL